MKVKVDVTINAFGILKGQILSDETLGSQYLSSLVLNGLAHYIQDDEVNQSEVDDYQAKSYPNKFLVIKDGSLYRANCDTSNTWVASEWDLKIKGA